MTFTKIKTKKNPERPAGAEGNFHRPKIKKPLPGMNDRIRRLRKQSVETQESLSIERALITTRFYRENLGKYSDPMMRALNFMEICKQKTIYIGKDEFIVGERGPCTEISSYFSGTDLPQR